MNPVSSTSSARAIAPSDVTAQPRPMEVVRAPAPTGRPAVARASKPVAAVRPAEPARPSVPLDERYVLASLFAIPIGVTLRGLHYYFSPLGIRMRDPLHSWLKPGGTLGLWFGVAGLALFIFMWLYPLRKKLKWLAWTGPIGTWLNIHVLAGLWVPLVVAVHAGWRFDGMIGLGYWAMIMVSLSGVIGRYIYVRIPHSRSGLELSLDDVGTERRALVTKIGVTIGLDPAAVERALATDQRPYDGLGPLQTLMRFMKDDWARERAVRKLRHEWRHPGSGARVVDRHALDEALKLARREMSLSQQMRMLDATRTVFGFWHVAHRPVAITALLAVLIHVIVAFTIGGVGRAGGLH